MCQRRWLSTLVCSSDQKNSIAALSPAAPTRSFFSLLQKNVLNTRRWDTREDLRLAMVRWIETKYNRRRRQRGLGKLTPVEFEMIYATAIAA